MESIIKVQNLSRHFSQYKKEPGLAGTIKALFKREYRTIKAVNDVSFEVQKGEIIGFIGPNGAGKTTTLKMLSGLIHPTGGQVSVLGYTPYERRHDFLKKISLVMGQKAQLWLELPAMETFLLNKEIYDIPTGVFEERVEELSEMLGVKEILDIQVRKLSLGQRMKCELMAALLHNPEVLFLDEPTIGLDIVVQKRIRTFLKELNRRYKTTILLTSHYMGDVKEMSDRLIIIDKGKLLYDDKLNQLTKKFAANKYLKVDFEQKIEREALEKFGEIVAYSDLSATLSVPSATHTKIAAEILNKYEIDNLDIQEVGLDEIITKIFQEGQVR